MQGIENFIKNAKKLYTHSEQQKGYLTYTNEEALLFISDKPKYWTIHTFFMKFPIDLFFLDEDYKIVHFRLNMQAWKWERSKEKVKYVLEVKK